MKSVLSLILAVALLPLPACTRAAAQSSAPELAFRVSAQPAQRGVPRLGLNLGSRTSWGAEQLMANVLLNPGFEATDDGAIVIVRQAIAGDVADGIVIPRGTIIMMSPWVLHRHRKFWRDPDAFDPTRFLPGAPTPPRFAYLPFGAGPRVCVGAQFALAEATLVLARLAKSFDITRDSAEPVLPVDTTQPDHAPMFRLRERAAT